MARFVLEVSAVLAAAFLYYRSGILYTFYANTPAKLQHVNELHGYETRFQDVVRNCEDAYLHEGEGWALLSCDPGRDEWNTVMGHFVNPAAPPQTGLYFYNYLSAPNVAPQKVDMGHSSAKQLQDFHPLGLEYHAPSKTLLVANHARTHTKLEMYTFDAGSQRGQLLRTLEGPNFTSANSIAMLNEKEFFFTNDHYFIRRETPLLATIEEYAGIPGGTVNYVKLLDNGEVIFKTLARMSFANGVALMNTTHLAAASTSSAVVYLYQIVHDEQSGEVSSLLLAKTISVPFLPDNLSVDSAGKILIAGHPHAPSIGKVSAMRQHCNKPEDAGKEECQFPSLSWVSEWSEAEGLKTLFAGDEFGSSTTMVRDVKNDFGIVTGLYDKGLLVSRRG